MAFNPELRPAQGNSEYARRINRVIDYIRENLNRPVKLEELARIMKWITVLLGEFAPGDLAAFGFLNLKLEYLSSMSRKSSNASSGIRFARNLRSNIR